MREICQIGSTIWAEQEVTKFPLLRLGCAFHYAFYDEKTGEVWARRIVIGAKEATWVYVSSPKESLDITIPYEWNEDCVPLGLMCAIIAGWKSPS